MTSVALEGPNPTWDTFYRVVLTFLTADQRASFPTQHPTSHHNRDAIQDYFTAAVASAAPRKARKARKAKASESELARICLDPLVNLGLTILEDTISNCVKNYSFVASKAERNCPLFVTSVLAIKKCGEVLNSGNGSLGREKLAFVTQLASQLESLLRITPERTVAFGVISNLHEAVFVAVVVEMVHGKRIYQAYHSSVIPTEILGRELGHFFATEPACFSVVPGRFTHDDFEYGSFMGRGSTGAVVSGTFQGDPVVVKVTAHGQALTVERAAVAFLRSKGVLLIPEIHAAAQAAMSDNFCHCCTVFSSVFTPVPNLTQAHLVEVWDILKQVHAAGVAHRDIRPPNIMLNADNHIVLIDFSSAQFFGPALTDEGRAAFEAALRSAMSTRLLMLYCSLLLMLLMPDLLLQ